MNLLCVIKDSDFGLDISTPARYLERQAARALVFDEDGNIVLLHATKKNYHKLPGGGMEENESIETALRREVSEEVGSQIKNIRELGIIEEYRNNYKLHQISHCFLADVDGEKHNPNFTDEEAGDGFAPEWMKIEEAIKVLEKEKDVEDYEGKFIQMRDLTFLREASRFLSNSKQI